MGADFWRETMNDRGQGLRCLLCLVASRVLRVIFGLLCDAATTCRKRIWRATQAVQAVMEAHAGYRFGQAWALHHAGSRLVDTIFGNRACGIWQVGRVVLFPTLTCTEATTLNAAS